MEEERIQAEQEHARREKIRNIQKDIEAAKEREALEAIQKKKEREEREKEEERIRRNMKVVDPYENKK